MLGRFAANIRTGLSLITRMTAGKVAVGTIIAVSLVTPQGWRLLLTIGAVGLLFAAAGAYLGIDLAKEDDTDASADLS
jgi:hypothetical protein